MLAFRQTYPEHTLFQYLYRITPHILQCISTKLNGGNITFHLPQTQQTKIASKFNTDAFAHKYIKIKHCNLIKYSDQQPYNLLK